MLTNFRIDRLSNTGASLNNRRPTFEYDFFSLAREGHSSAGSDCLLFFGVLGFNPSHFGPLLNLIVYIFNAKPFNFGSRLRIERALPLKTFFFYCFCFVSHSSPNHIYIYGVMRVVS